MSAIRDGNRFENSYTDSGLLIHQMKYGLGNRKYLCIEKRQKMIKEFLVPRINQAMERAGFPKDLLIIPVPSYLSGGKPLVSKPQYEIAEAVAYSHGRKAYRYLSKVSDISVKTSSISMELPEGVIRKAKQFQRPADVLLIDDVYCAGTTLRACIKELRKDPMVGSIYFLAITKTRRAGLRTPDAAA